jgi:hypothetical protein
MNNPSPGITGGERRLRFRRPLDTPMPVLALAVLVGVLAGCASLHWARPGTDEETTQNDAQECRAIARQQALNMTRRPLFVPYFTEVRDRNGRIRSIPVVPFQQFGPPVWMADAPGLAIDQMTLKSDLYDSCLQAKGYRLVEDETPAASPPAASPPAVTPE